MTESSSQWRTHRQPEQGPLVAMAVHRVLQSGRGASAISTLVMLVALTTAPAQAQNTAGQELEEVVEHPHRTDERASHEDDTGVPEDLLVAEREERELLGNRVARRKTPEHRHSPEVGDRDRVDVAVADLGNRSCPQSDLPRDHPEQVGDDRGGEEDSQVLAHGRRLPLVLVGAGDVGAERLDDLVQALEQRRVALGLEAAGIVAVAELEALGGLVAAGGTAARPTWSPAVSTTPDDAPASVAIATRELIPANAWRVVSKEVMVAL